jgi:Mrp family chromosome partitioning ATPase
MNGIAIHFVPRATVTLFSSLWLYLSVSGVILLFLLVIFILKSRKKRKGVVKLEKQPISQNADIQQILKVLQKPNGQMRPVLLAASGLADLPVTIPVNLAVSLSNTGKCLLIDLDTHLKISPVPTEFDNLSVWPARYFDLLKQMDLRSLLDSASQKYDHILLYAPYLTVLADRKLIASCSKQAILLCKDIERREQLSRLLKKCDCEILLNA